MIGVIHRDEHRAAVEEFFELFKTPWEPYRPQGAYHTLLVAADATVPETDARLVVIFSAAPRADDTAHDVVSAGTLAGIALGTSLLAWKLWERRMRV